MSVIKVALLQSTAEEMDPSANLAKGIDLCRRAKEMGADIALFPEMWSIGYSFPDAADERSVREWTECAVDARSEFLKRFPDLAAELSMAIAVTYLQKWEGSPRNAVSIIDRHGVVALEYAKVHTCDFGAESSLSPGDSFPVASLDTRMGPVQVGAMICYDREFPESARVLMLAGAELILVPNACELEQNRLGQFKARAFENMVALAMANYASPKCNGHSMAVSPIAFDAQERSLDVTLVEADENEGIWLASFDMDAIRAYRRRETWGDAYRKPRAYAGLDSRKVREPFRRSGSRR